METTSTATIRSFRAQLRRLERIVEGHLRRDICCHGVSVAQCHTLLAVEMLVEPSLTDLAAEASLDKSTLSRTVEGLVQSGLLVRMVDQRDRRVIRLGLTVQGAAVCSDIHRQNDERYRRVLASLDRDADEVVAIFAELVEAIATTHDDPATMSPKEPRICQEKMA